ncbi:unnamed protein product [Prunus armeniaca]
MMFWEFKPDTSGLQVKAIFHRKLNLELELKELAVSSAGIDGVGSEQGQTHSGVTGVKRPYGSHGNRLGGPLELAV